jgi:hypothetical protein
LVFPLRFWRRLGYAGIGFVLGYVSLYTLFLYEARTTPHFAALYDRERPHGLIAWLRFQHSSEAVFLLAGVVGAMLAVVASFARARAASAPKAS